MTRPFRVTFSRLSLPVALVFSNCGDGLDLVPYTGPGSRATTTPTPLVTPTATPATTPTPASGLTCQLAARPDCGASCCSEGGAALFNSQINDAQADLERTRPDIFNTNGSLRLDELEYTDLLARKITSMFGLCAVGGGRDGNSRSKDEVGIKSDNNVSQNVDVIIGSSHTPYIGGRYTCRPASF